MIRLGFGLGFFYLVIGYTLYYWISFVFWIFHKVISYKKQNLKTFYIIPLASFFFFLSSSTSFNIFRLLFHICLIFTLISQFKVPYPWNYYQFLCCKHSLFWFSSRQLISLETDFYIFCISEFQFFYFACGYQVCPTLLDKQISLSSCLNKFSILWKMISEFLQSL